MKKLFFLSLLSLAWMAGKGQHDTTKPIAYQSPLDSTWHIRGTRKMVTRHFIGFRCGALTYVGQKEDCDNIYRYDTTLLHRFRKRYERYLKKQNQMK